jgi:hypothetical protein
MQGGIIGLVGLQGVGKSSALRALYVARMRMAEAKRRVRSKEEEADYDVIFFKWLRQPELFQSLLDGIHEASTDYNYDYKKILSEELESRNAESPLGSGVSPELINVDSAERELGSTTVKKLRQITWLLLLRRKNLILIDTPDYSKTDRRLMAKDLQEIYWLWNTLTQTYDARPNFVIAIQKEMFQDHYFFDKMEKVELHPLEPEQLVGAYVRVFKKAEPFTEDALLTLARMSRGIFRRFLRYITLTLDLWTTQPEPRTLINKETVEKAIPYERLVEDMETELLELFPKQSDLRLQAVQLLMRLSESGPKKQSILAEELGLESYVMSRLLTKLELHHYVTRERDGTDKIVTLTKS